MPIVILLYEGYNLNFLMSMAHLIVTDFGAIKSANIEIKKYNFFIGHTSSGKSTIAKLLAIFNNSIFGLLKKEISIVS